MVAKKVSEVFKTVGLPQYTYVKPRHYGEIRSDIEQDGKHLLIEGPSGIGKTCVVFKVFEDLFYSENSDYIYISCREPEAELKTAALLNEAKAGKIDVKVIFLDDFHFLPELFRNELGDRLKEISDTVFTGKKAVKLILVGIPAAGGSILAKAGDLGPRIGGYRFSTASDKEINHLIDDGEAALNVIFDDRDIILSEASGNFWLAQYICNKICSIKEIFEARDVDNLEIIQFDLLNIRDRILSELSTRFMDTAVAFSKGKKWRPGGNKPYLELFLALSRLPDSVIPFDKILGIVSERRRPGIKAIKPRIASVINNMDTGIDLRKQIAFEDPSFSIEDPLFRYFLTHLSREQLLTQMGLSHDEVEKTSIYAYDVAFSFAGEVRPIVERLNEELKNQDVVTFYDFDQQATLLGDDLEEALRSVYSVSAKYYVVFLDDFYVQKVWTKFEKDIMTHAGRSKHIIPVILSEVGKSGAVGISSTIGRIDLLEVWSDFKRNGKFFDDNVSLIRNRALLPLLEKIDDYNGD